MSEQTRAGGQLNPGGRPTIVYCYVEDVARMCAQFPGATIWLARDPVTGELLHAPKRIVRALRNGEEPDGLDAERTQANLDKTR